MAVSKRLRYEILRRDNHTCRYCGAKAPDVALTVDHVLAVALGGSDEPNNLVTACADCNSGKSSMPADAPLLADVNQDALRWATAMRRAVELAEVDRATREQVERELIGVFDDYPVPSYRGGGTLASQIPGDYFVSIEQFLKAGLTRVDIIEAAYIAAEAPNVRADAIWRYFCGVCNRKIQRLHEQAAQLIEPGRQDAAKVGGWLSNGEKTHAFWTYAHLSLVTDWDAIQEMNLA